MSSAQFTSERMSFCGVFSRMTWRFSNNVTVAWIDFGDDKTILWMNQTIRIKLIKLLDELLKNLIIFLKFSRMLKVFYKTLGWECFSCLLHAELILSKKLFKSFQGRHFKLSWWFCRTLFRSRWFRTSYGKWIGVKRLKTAKNPAFIKRVERANISDYFVEINTD